MNDLAKYAAQSRLSAATHAITDAELELRNAVRDAIDTGCTAAWVAQQLHVGVATVWRIHRGDRLNRAHRLTY